MHLLCRARQVRNITHIFNNTGTISQSRSVKRLKYLISHCSFSCKSELVNNRKRHKGNNKWTIQSDSWLGYISSLFFGGSQFFDGPKGQKIVWRPNPLKWSGSFCNTYVWEQKIWGWEFRKQIIHKDGPYGFLACWKKDSISPLTSVTRKKQF